MAAGSSPAGRVERYYFLADVLGMKIAVDHNLMTFTGNGKIKAPCGIFTLPLELRVVTSIVQDTDDERMSFIVAASPGDLGLYVEYEPLEQSIVLALIDRAKLFKRGSALFEEEMYLQVEEGRKCLLDRLGVTELRAFVGRPKKGWVESCLKAKSLAPSSSGFTGTSVQ